MSSDTPHLPTDYAPYRELQFCSNRFVNTPIAIEVDGHPPVLVGVEGLRVWLSAPPGPSKHAWTPVVVDGKAQVPGVKVRRTSQGAVEVIADRTKVVEVRELDADTAAVTWLDLRPLGLNVHGDAGALWIGTNQFSSNRVENCRVAIGIGQQAPPGASDPSLAAPPGKED